MHLNHDLSSRPMLPSSYLSDSPQWSASGQPVLINGCYGNQLPWTRTRIKQETEYPAHNLLV